GTAPIGIVLETADPLIALGSVVADELYNKSIPVVVVDDFESAQTSTSLSIAGSQLLMQD
ncbi:MAG: DUF126 domain-containing protein, partial [Acidimicrobiia bacterium]|nr:DUF126 domain-containing protein [Acidimicrobiia bacterium]